MAIVNESVRHSAWHIDPLATRVEFSIKVFRFKTDHGRFHCVAGTVLADDQDPTASVVEATIDAASIDTGLKRRDKHLIDADFLDVDRHPTITFQSTRIEQLDGRRFRVTGDLAIRGVTRPVEIEAHVDQLGYARAIVTATTVLDRHDFGMSWNRLGAIASEVAVHLHLELRRAPARAA